MFDEKLNMSKQSALRAQPANHNLSCIERGVSSRWWEVILPLYVAPGRHQLECCIQRWGSQHKKDKDLLEWVQKRATKRIRGLEYVKG